MPSPSPSPPTLPLYATYRLSRGETHVFSSHPPYATYKATLLPLWRFRTPAVARTSADAIYARFLAYDTEDDFVGMDMCRKYLQMGMTRAKRYANYKGGRKYVAVKDGEAGEGGVAGGEDVDDRGKGKGERKRGKVQREKSEGHTDKAEKEEASQLFRAVWERCRAYEGYVEKKNVFLERQRAWDREQKKKKRKGGDGGTKHQGEGDADIKDEIA